MSGEWTTLSKFLALVLRHDPKAIGLTLSDQGWVSVDELLAALAQHGRPLARAALQQLVANSDKQRFAFSADGRSIRANQGHSVAVDLGLLPVQPPDVLFHGTVTRALPAIAAQGLLKGKRHHVHLSATAEVAQTVGARRGAAVVLEIDARAMTLAQHSFYRSKNGVWLTDHVPTQFLLIPMITE